MVPKIAKPGKNFIGLHRYLFFDPETGQQSERVDFTATRNFMTDETEEAAWIMASIAGNQESIKIAAGTDLRGRKLKTFVSHLILSWPPGDNPSQEEMLKAADETIKLLGAQDYQVFIIAHNDTGHKHLHIVINRVHPVTGRALKLNYSKRKLSLWAEGYEQRQGHIHCPARVSNNRKLRELAELRRTNPKAAKGKLVRGRNPVIQAAWDETDTGTGFAAFLSEKGYVLAQGERKRKDGSVCRFVAVDPHGKTINIARHIEGENGKNIRVAAIRERFKDIEPYALPSATIARLDREELLYEARTERQQAAMARKGCVPCPITDHYNICAARLRETQQKQTGRQSGGDQALILAFSYSGSGTSRRATSENTLDSIQLAQPPPVVFQDLKPQHSATRRKRYPKFSTPEFSP